MNENCAITMIMMIMMMMIVMMYCRHVPSWEITAVARYLANLFSCNVQSLPTELLIHSYWTLMPRQFARVGGYSHCLRTRTRPLMSRTCQRTNPYYCGRRFGEQASLDRLTACRQLLAGGDTASYTVPAIVRTKTNRYRACLDRSRTMVVLESYL